MQPSGSKPLQLCSGIIFGYQFVVYSSFVKILASDTPKCRTIIKVIFLCRRLALGHGDVRPRPGVYGFGGMERWNGMDWTGLEWTGMEWNDRSTNFVGVAKLCPRQFQYPALSA